MKIFRWRIRGIRLGERELRAVGDMLDQLRPRRALRDARDFALKFQRDDVFRDYVVSRMWAVLPVVLVFIGPADLHASLGYPGETNNPKVMPIIDDAIRRIRKAGKAPGILTGVEADARRWLECGGLFVAVGADTGVLARGTEALAAKFKS